MFDNVFVQLWLYIQDIIYCLSRNDKWENIMPTFSTVKYTCSFDNNVIFDVAHEVTPIYLSELRDETFIWKRYITSVPLGILSV